MKKIGKVESLFNDEAAGYEDGGKTKNNLDQFFT